VAAHSKDFMILGVAVLYSARVWRTDGRPGHG